jgi:hypothetical protein
MPIGYKSHQCNVLYYNPNQVYEMPKASSGTPLPTPSFRRRTLQLLLDGHAARSISAATSRAYDTSTRQYQTVSDTAQAAYYYLHSVAGAKNYLNPPCTDVRCRGQRLPPAMAARGRGSWCRRPREPGGVDERQNFANWYTYLPDPDQPRQERRQPRLHAADRQLSRRPGHRPIPI